MQPLSIEEVVEQCDPKLHDGCFIKAEIEEYSFNYTFDSIVLIGKGIALDLKKGCAIYDNYISDTTGKIQNGHTSFTYRNLS